MKILVTSPSVAWTPDATMPSIPLSTDASGPHTWTWKLSWNTFSATGTAQTPDNNWDAAEAAAQGGGSLTVTASAASDTASAALTVTGTNPTTAQLEAFLQAQPNVTPAIAAVLAKIFVAESGAANFHATGQPIVSFDHGYGICQLTSPVPNFLQIWNWQHNVLGGLTLFKSKLDAATVYLGQGGRSFTPDQQLREAVSRWNGGPYHALINNAWVRQPTIVCDPQAGNIGWDMTDPRNAGQTVAALHARDAASYRVPPAVRAWKYFGVCYADHLLGS
jgi:hypothetical protein